MNSDKDQEFPVKQKFPISADGVSWHTKGCTKSACLCFFFFLIILFVQPYYSNQGSLNSCVVLDSFGFQLQYPKRSSKIKMLSFRGHQSDPLPYQEENFPLQSFIL